MPLKKKAIPTTVTDFRPIALLSFLSKVLEKIVQEQISAYLFSLKILDPFQSGFRPYHSTQTALLKLTEDIRSGIDNKKQLLTILLLFDYSKAFDTISPSKLLCKLIRMGFSKGVVLWIKSYITGRNQKVVTKLNGNSDWLTTNLGVPQGSVLGPLLLSLYINDLQTVLSDLNKGSLTGSVKHLLYADDLQTYTLATRENLYEGIERLSAVARAVSAWASANALSLNVGKTKAIIFGSDHNINILQSIHLPGIEIQDNVFIPFSDTVTNLGVVMDSKLTWEPQVVAVSHKVNRALYGLRLFRSCTTEALRKRLASALVLSHLDYCSCVRYVCGARRDEHISPYRSKLDWLDLPGRRAYFTAVLMYKTLNLGQPAYLVALFQKCQSRSSGRTASRELTVPSSRTDTGLNSFKAQGAHTWNSIPRNIKYLSTLSKFKTAIRTHLLHRSANVDFIYTI